MEEAVLKLFRHYARRALQEELFDTAVLRRPRPKRSPRAKGHNAYTRAEFDPELHRTLRALSDPENLDKVTVVRVLAFMPVSKNTLWGLLKDYGYAQPHETLARCLRRLADEWNPEWRGVNRQRF